MSKKKKKSQSETIDPNNIKSRDPLMVSIINGATKAGIHKDLKKEASRKEARKKISKDYED